MASTDDKQLFAPLPDALASAPAKAEEETLREWRTKATFESVQRSRADAPSFVFWEGPPTANGRPGIHHIFARTIKDAVCRFQTMNGKRVVRKAGWDTHGLPVELEVEKKLKISGKPEIERYGVAAFNAQCRESVWTYRKDWEELSERVGYWLDYADPYVTYEADYVESVWWILAQFHKAGFVYRGKKVLPYCGRCGTGLSSHELGQPGVYRDILDPSVIIRFKLKSSALARADARLATQQRPESLLAWTTTPWTLPSNVALAVHPDKTYCALELPTAVGTEVVWVVRERLDALFTQKEWQKLKEAGRAPLLGELLGSQLVGLEYEPLFAERVGEVDPGAWTPDPRNAYRVVAAQYVTVEDGTGIVHQAPTYGVDDWNTAAKSKLPVFQAVGPEGKFTVDVGGVKSGTFFKDADDALMEDLKHRGLMFKKSRENHSYPHCWRCDTPLFYFAAPAWYVRTSAHKERMVEMNKKIRWIPPEVGTGRFGEWLANNVDWNISRDRYWGTPLPFFVCDKDETHERAVGSVAELKQLAGSLPEGFDNHKPLIDDVTFRCDRCAGTMRRTKSVLDCWFDSGAMPYAQYHFPFGAGKQAVLDQFPADFIAEGLDQTRGWFYTLHAIGTLLAAIPEVGLPAGPTYKTCVVNGLVLDKDGVKMSKRLGNVVDPWKAIAEHGADAVRWYLLASGAPWLPKKFDPNGLLDARKRFFGTLINSYKFFADYARLPDGFDPRRDRVPEVKARPEIDRWLASITTTLIRDVRAKLDAYDLSGACQSLEEFVVDELSNWYIRRNRARFWKGSGADKTSAFATLHHALETVALLLAPIAPFMSEMLYERLAPGRGSVHAQRLPEVDPRHVDEDLEASMRNVVKVVEMGRALRERANVKIKTPLRAIHVRSSDERAIALLKRSFASELVLDELNIKAFGSLGADDGKLCTLRAKANFKVLGKKIGGLMKAAAASIEKLDAAQVAELRAGRALRVPAGSDQVDITAEDVEIKVETTAAFDVETDGRFVVFLDTKLDDELVAEGLARDVVTRVNALRKSAGLAIDERIRLRLDPGPDPLLARAIEVHGDRIRGETLSIECSRSNEAFAAGVSETADLGDGRVLTIHLVRA